MSLYEWITTALVPLTGIVSWLAATRLRKNNTLGQLQETINMLVGENKNVYQVLADTREELSNTRRQLSEANEKIGQLEANQRKLLEENAELKQMIKKLSEK